MKIYRIVLICVLSFTVYWFATEYQRELKAEIDGVEFEISQFRRGIDDRISISIYGKYEDQLRNDPEYIAFLAAKVDELCVNKEYEILDSFMGELDTYRFWYEEVWVALERNINSASSLEDAFKIIGIFEYPPHYYEIASALTKDSEVIKAYIEEHETNKITLTPGKGYYADHKDEYSHNTVGITESHLSDSKKVTYMGDFMYIKRSGVKLNSSYQEVGYSEIDYYFRDESIQFDPTEGECVWTGDYLLHFAEDGKLLHYLELS